MTYAKTSWTDRQVQYPSRFTRTSDGTYDTLLPAPGTVANSGTPITAAALNNMENGISANDLAVTDHETRLDNIEAKYVKMYRETGDGALILQKAATYLFGTTTPNANVLVSITDTAHAQKYLLINAHIMIGSSVYCDTIVSSILTYVSNSLGTITVSGLSGQAEFRVIGLE